MVPGNILTTIVAVILVSFLFEPCLATIDAAGDGVDDYELMPPLFSYENVTDCFERYSSSLYCVVKTVLKPDSSSEIWRAIEKFSKGPSYHEHSLLDRGLCVEACVDLVSSLHPSAVALFDTERVRVEPYHRLSIPSEKDLPEQQSSYGKILNVCVNYHLWQRYNLSGYSELERCVTSATQWPILDLYHGLFLLIVVSLTALVVCATFAEFRNSSQANANGGYRTDLWAEFSLRRSWSQLMAEPRTRLQRDFAFVEIFRLLSVFLILTIHVSMLYTSAPTANPRPLEEMFDHTLSRIAASVFPFQVHTFFTISGVMLAVYFLEQAATKGPIGWSFFPKAIVMRYLRIFPTLFMLWLYQASWFDRLSEGPGDYRFFELEKDNCRTNGWLNFLFLNNYFKYSNMCMQQSWHLAADFHFFIVGVPFLLFINRYPALTKPLVIVATVVSIGAPVVNLYRWKLPGVILVNFKQLRFIFYGHPVLEHDYMLSHAHGCSYFAGIFAGMAYHRYRGTTFDGGKILWMIRWVPPAMVLLQASLSPLFYSLDYSEPLLWNAMYGALHRCCWGAMCAVAIVHGATVWRGRYAKIHFHPVLLVLSRLSFGVFMVQFSVLKSLARNAAGDGIAFSWNIFLQSVGYTCIVCYAAALLLALLVELPVAAICKRIFGSKLRAVNKEIEMKMK